MVSKRKYKRFDIEDLDWNETRTLGFLMEGSHNPASTEKIFFEVFGLIFQYVSPLEPWIWDPKEIFFCLYGKYDF